MELTPKYLAANDWWLDEEDGAIWRHQFVNFELHATSGGAWNVLSDHRLLGTIYSADDLSRLISALEPGIGGTVQRKISGDFSLESRMFFAVNGAVYRLAELRARDRVYDAIVACVDDETGEPVTDAPRQGTRVVIVDRAWEQEGEITWLTNLE